MSRSPPQATLLEAGFAAEAAGTGDGDDAHLQATIRYGVRRLEVEVFPPTYGGRRTPGLRSVSSFGNVPGSAEDAASGSCGIAARHTGTIRFARAAGTPTLYDVVPSAPARALILPPYPRLSGAHQ